MSFPWQMPYSDDYVVGKVTYNAAGRVHERFDNLGRKTVTEYDLLGRTGKVIENPAATADKPAKTPPAVDFSLNDGRRRLFRLAPCPPGLADGRRRATRPAGMRQAGIEKRRLPILQRQTNAPAASDTHASPTSPLLSILRLRLRAELALR